jgi:hypothetical protein
MLLSRCVPSDRMIQQQYNRISGTGEHSLTHGIGFDFRDCLVDDPFQYERLSHRCF